MCNEYDCNNNRPLGLQDAEMAWNERQRKAQTAMTSDIYTNGGLLDRTSATGYEEPVFYPSTIRQILERDFSYEELKFISGARLANMSMADIDRLISLLEKLKKSIKNIPANGLPTPVTPSTPSWGTPYYGFGGSVQPLYGCPIPQHVEAEAQKGPNEPDDQEKETPSLHDSVWNNKPSTVRAALYNGLGIPGAPEPGFKNRTRSSTRVVLSAKEASSKDDSSLAKVVTDGPSTGVVINDNPVSLTEENKSVDEEKKND
jgi:hypothetical protein